MQAAKPGGKNIGQGYKFASVASRFKRQLAELMDALHTMEPHYIRCIKPNSFNRCQRPPACDLSAVKFRLVLCWLCRPRPDPTIRYRS